MKRILFVDDDANVLQGLQRMLRGMRNEWEMVFAQDGSTALQALAGQPFDVVVSDLRMPAMDGAQLLEEVARRHPQTVRITLSGQAGGELLLRAAGAAHQSLSKPCDAATLKNVVARACVLRELLVSESLKGLVSQMSSLPSLPELYRQLVAELRSPDASVQRAGELISQDVAMTAKVLQLVNSAFFGLPRRVSSPMQAVSLLGLNTIKALVLSVHVFSQLDPSRVEAFDLRSLQAHSLATGTIAKQIAGAEDPARSSADHALIAGLLHDAGKLVLAVNLPDRYSRVMALQTDQRTTLPVAEREVLNTTHAEIGAYLLGLWGLPDPVVEAVAFHHSPRQCPGRGFSPLVAVHAANALDKARHSSAGPGTAEELDLDYLAEVGLASRVSTWRKMADKISSDGEVA